MMPISWTAAPMSGVGADDIVMGAGGAGEGGAPTG